MHHIISLEYEQNECKYSGASTSQFFIINILQKLNKCPKTKHYMLHKQDFCRIIVLGCITLHRCYYTGGPVSAETGEAKSPFSSAERLGGDISARARLSH